MTKVAGIKRS